MLFFFINDPHDKLSVDLIVSVPEFLSSLIYFT